MSAHQWRLTVEPGVTLNVRHDQPEAPVEGTPPILLINGILMSTNSWTAFARELSSRHGRAVIRYDMRGQGTSDAPAGAYLRDRHALDLLLLLQDLKARGLTPLHVMALSNGGYVAQQLLTWQMLTRALATDVELPGADHELIAALPDLIASLTLVSTFSHVDARLAAIVRSWLGALSWGGPNARFDVAVPWVWGPEFIAAHAAVLASAREQATAIPEAATRSLLEGLVTPTPDPAVNPLGEPPVPLTVAVGEDDVLTPARSNRSVLTLFGKSAQELKLIPRAGHASPIENQAAVLELLLGTVTAAESRWAREGPAGRGRTM